MSKDDHKDKHGTVHSYVGSGVEMDGVLKFEGAMHLNGKYKGKIESNGFLVVGENGFLNADIEIGDIENNGRISGNINCVNKIHFKNTSQVKGDIKAKRLDIDEGAEFLGSCNMVFSDHSKKQEKKEENASAPTTTVALPILDEGEKKTLKKGLGIIAALFILVFGALTAYNNGYLNMSSKGLDSYIQEGQEAFLAGEYTQAKELFNEALKKKPKSIKVNESLADIAIKEKNNSEAEAYLLKAFELDTTNLTILEKLIAIREEAGNTEGTIDLYRKKLSLVDNDVDTRKKYAELLIKQGNLAGAAEQYEAVIKSSPTDIETLKTLAAYYKENDKLYDVIETYKKISQLEPNKIDNFLILGKYLLMVGLEKQANEAYSNVEMLDPDNLEVKNNEGFRLYEEGSYTKSKGVFNFVVRSEPKNVRGLLGLATNYSKTGSPTRAIKAAYQAIELEPNNASVLNRLAWSLAVSNRDVPKALEYSQQSLAINPDVPEHIDTISEIYFRLNNFEKAVENIKRALQLDPENVYYQSQLAKFEKAAAKQKGQ